MTAPVATPRAEAEQEQERCSPKSAAWSAPAAAPWLFALAVFLVSAWVRFDGIDLVLTADEGYWVHRTVRFGAALADRDLTQTFRTGHPGVTVTWVGLLGIGPTRLEPFLTDRYPFAEDLERAPGYSQLLDAARRGVALAVSGLLAVIVLLAWRLLGPVPALIGGGLLTLDPYVVGMTRLLHVDALLAPLMTVSALAGLVYWTQSRRWPYLLLSAAAGGLALLTKAPAGCLPIYFALVGMILLVAGRRRPAPRVGAGWVLAGIVAWGLIALLVYVLLFPALWVAPVQRVRDLIAFLFLVGLEPHPTNYFLGLPTRGDPGWLYYPLVLPLRASPLAMLGMAGLAFKALDGERRWQARWLLLYVVLFAALMTLGPKKLDRYMLPVLMVMDLLAGIGLWRLAAHLGGALARGSVRRLTAAILGACLVVQGVLLALSEPYPIAFYNPLAGGAARASQLFMIGWGEGLEQVTTFLDAQPNADRLKVATNYIHVVQPRFEGWSIPINLYFDDAPAQPLPTPDYIVLYVNSVQRRQVPPLARRAILAGPPEFVARVNGLEYAWVYAVPASEPRIDAPVPTVNDAEPEDR